ncbi:MAG TPA: NAD(P)/FAD-dependent oxidoreductase, partial [Thermoplasmata archaeon]|nr:NAD(P)/FAD-dependent oxidoreductase [Thermoplasmata archaeon]
MGSRHSSLQRSVSLEMPRRIVIIGHGPAGRTAAGYASLTDRNAEITVLNASEHDVYHPCSLPFAIGGHVDLDAIVEEVHYRKVRLLNRTRATAIDPEARTVSAVGPDGEEMAFGYDALLIATGSRPVVPAAIESTDRPEVLTLRTPHDAAAIIERAGTARRAVVVGGSAIGLELSSELAGRGISTTLVEAETTLMPGRLDPDMSSAVERHLGADGVDVVTGCPVTAIRPADDDRAVLVRAGDR